MIQHEIDLNTMRVVSQETSAERHTDWPEFYEKMRMDIIEAQCALFSGRKHRALELMEELLRDARSRDRVLASSPTASAGELILSDGHGSRKKLSTLRNTSG